MTSDAVAKLAEAFTDHRKAGFLRGFGRTDELWRARKISRHSG
jgi:hypothetical protein